ncbi:hypothetical protein CS542_04985 [Pedobacter sp. IW39]|nr:hypothetical protein CS542_04985 [Pedobacter sp. IW39]
MSLSFMIDIRRVAIFSIIQRMQWFILHQQNAGQNNQGFDGIIESTGLVNTKVSILIKLLSNIIC